jgi:hypothetical protein
MYVIWQRLLTSGPCLLHADAQTALNLEEDVYNYDKKLELDRHVRVSTYATSGLGLILRTKPGLPCCRCSSWTVPTFRGIAPEGHYARQYLQLIDCLRDSLTRTPPTCLSLAICLRTSLGSGFAVWQPPLGNPSLLWSFGIHIGL